MSVTNSILERGADRRSARVSESPQDVLAALEDPACRKILETVADERLTAQEIVAESDVPESTTYRKVEKLTEAGLVEERVRISSSGHHATDYQKSFEDVTVTVAESGRIEVEVTGSADSRTAIGRRP